MRLTIIRRPHRLLLFACTLLCDLALAREAKADFIVSVNTSSISGTQGFIDIQFNPGINSLAATVTIANFSTDATLLSSLNSTPAGTDGGGSGTLPGTLTISNTGAFNDVYQPVTYGSFISFDVAFSGPAVTSPNLNDSGSSFGLTLYASDFATTLLTTDPNGTVGTINLNSDGTTTAFTFPDSNGNTDAKILPASVPEPSTWLLLTAGGTALWIMRNRLGSSCPLSQS